MTTQEKENILNAIKSNKTQRELSDAALAKKIGISPATMSQILGKKWELVSDDMWRRVAAAIGYTPDWQTAETTNFTRVCNAAKRAKKLAETLAISHEPGSGKSYALRHVANTLPNVIYLECEEHYKRKDFLNKLLAAMGVQTTGSVTELTDAVIENLLKIEKPLVILDEFDKLDDPVMKLFKSIWNKTENEAGFILAGAPYLRNRLEKGVSKNRQSYVEMWSRMGREYVELKQTTDADVAAICKANGIVAPETIGDIIRTADKRDLRQVKRAVSTKKLEMMAASRKGGMAA